MALLQEYRDNRSAAANDIAIAGAAETGLPAAGIGIALDKQFLRAEFCHTVKVDGVDGFIGTDRKDLFHAAVQRGIDHVLRTENIGLDRFKRIVLTGRDLLQSGGMDNNIHTLEGPLQPIKIPDISQKIAE